MVIARQSMLLPLALATAVALGSSLSMAALRLGRVRSVLARVVLLSLPMAAAAIGAFVAGGASMAITLAITCAVFAQLFILGTALTLPPRQPDDTTQLVTPSGAFVFAMGIILLLGGFAGRGTPAMLFALLTTGGVALSLLASQPTDPEATPSTAAGWTAGAWALALPAVVLVGLATQHLIAAIDPTRTPVSPEAFAIVLLSPAALLPLLTHVVHLSSRAKLTEAGNLASGVTLVALGILTPMAMVAQYAIQFAQSDTPRLPGLPPITWRLDSPLLLTSGFALLGMRFQMLRPDRWIGMVFLALYFAYLVASTVLRLQ